MEWINGRCGRLSFPNFWRMLKGIVFGVHGYRVRVPQVYVRLNGCFRVTVCSLYNLFHISCFTRYTCFLLKRCPPYH